MTDDPKMTTLEWCGPVGHVSKTHGELVPGRTYAMPDDLAEAVLDSVFWRKPGVKKPPVKAEEE